jgi:hypothetical protein
MAHLLTPRVGPVLTTTPAARALASAIQKTQPGAVIEDHEGYLRVLADRPCTVTRDAIEAELGEPFELPSDLERIMPSFRGRLLLTHDRVTWT